MLKQRIKDLIDLQFKDLTNKYVLSNLKPNVNLKPYCKISEDCEIGDYTYIGFRCVITKTSIGRYCSIGDNVTIGPGEHKLNDISTSGYFGDNSYEVMTLKPCVIGNDVWIGVDSIILRGVKIGNGAIIGANSVVTKDVPPYSVYVGSPAKQIKSRFSEVEIKIIEESKWWIKDPLVAQIDIDRLRNQLTVNDNI